MHVHRLLPGTATAAEGAVDAGDWGASPDVWPTAAWSLFIFAILASNYKCMGYVYKILLFYIHA